MAYDWLRTATVELANARKPARELPDCSTRFSAVWLSILQGPISCAEAGMRFTDAPGPDCRRRRLRSAAKKQRERSDAERPTKEAQRWHDAVCPLGVVVFRVFRCPSKMCSDLVTEGQYLRNDGTNIIHRFGTREIKTPCNAAHRPDVLASRTAYQWNAEVKSGIGTAAKAGSLPKASICVPGAPRDCRAISSHCSACRCKNSRPSQRQTNAQYSFTGGSNTEPGTRMSSI